MNHGHVTPNADGSKARCGGPAICSECAQELASLNKKKREHVESPNCWCGPDLIGDYSDDGGTKHYLHKDEQ